MEYINKTIEYPIYTSRAFQLYFGGMNIGVLDIETTGLSPKNSAFVLGGLATPTKNGLQAEQFFAETLSEEQQVLQDFWQRSSENDVLITFNGKHFDLPFMAERLDTSMSPMPYHLDLYLLVKNFSPIRQFLPNLRQKSIEDYMGLWQFRKDEISGGESVELYYRFLKEKSDDLKEKILLHNHDDIVQLYRLLKVIEKCDLHKAMFSMGFPVKHKDTIMIVESITLKGGQLRISGKQNRNPMEYQCYEYNGTMCFMHFNKNAQTFVIDLPLIEQSGFTLLDLAALGIDESPLDKYPTCQEGFLILKNQDNINHLEINHFIKIFIERMVSQWITNR